MSEILSNIVGWVAGLLLLGAVLLLANGAIVLFNRLVQGPKRLDYIAAVVTSDGIAKYAPQAVTGQPTGRTQVDMVKAASQLFGHAASVISEKELRQCAKKGRLSLITYQSGSVKDANAAVQLTANTLARRGVNVDALRRLKVYSITSQKTPADEMAYLVVLGNLPSPPSFMIVPSFD